MSLVIMFMREMFIIHYFRGNKRCFMAGVTFRVIHPRKSNRPFVRRSAPAFLLDPSGPWWSTVALDGNNDDDGDEHEKVPTDEVGRRCESDLDDASTSEKSRRISLPREIQSRWQGLINVMSMSGLLKHDTCCRVWSPPTG